MLPLLLHKSYHYLSSTLYKLFKIKKLTKGGEKIWLNVQFAVWSLIHRRNMTSIMKKFMAANREEARAKENSKKAWEANSHKPKYLIFFVDGEGFEPPASAM